MTLDQNEKLEALLKNIKRTGDAFSKKTGRSLKALSTNLMNLERQASKADAVLTREEKKAIDEIDAEVLKLFEEVK